MIMSKKFEYRKNILFLSILFLTVCFSFAGTHAVEKGETYYSISRKYGISVEQLCAVNNLTVNDVLKVGQKLSIPEKNVEKKNLPSSSPVKNTLSAERKFDTYTVQKGDTFYRIAKVNGISVEELKGLNNLDSDTVLKAGQRLKIPVTIVDTSASLPSLPSSDPRKYSDGCR